jgi:ABC-type dipeptide/oligopeptide/nickel transport system permease component
MDRAMPVRFVLWVTNIVTKFDFGYSYTFEKPVSQVIMERMGYTFAIALASALKVPIFVEEKVMDQVVKPDEESDEDIV